MTLDRFDPGRDQPSSSGRVPCALLPGDVLVPCLFLTHGDTSDALQSESDLHQCFKVSSTCGSCVTAFYCLFPSVVLCRRGNFKSFTAEPFCVSVIAAVAERQAKPGPGSAADGQGSYHLFSAVRRHFVQPQLVVRLSVRGTGRAGRQSCPHHPHRAAAESNQRSATTAPARPL